MRHARHMHLGIPPSVCQHYAGCQMPNRTTPPALPHSINTACVSNVGGTVHTVTAMSRPIVHDATVAARHPHDRHQRTFNRGPPANWAVGCRATCQGSTASCTALNPYAQKHVHKAIIQAIIQKYKAPRSSWHVTDRATCGLQTVCRL
jgi:hypothetical protein